MQKLPHRHSDLFSVLWLVGLALPSCFVDYVTCEKDRLHCIRFVVLISCFLSFRSFIRTWSVRALSFVWWRARMSVTRSTWNDIHSIDDVQNNEHHIKPPFDTLTASHLNFDCRWCYIGSYSRLSSFILTYFAFAFQISTGKTQHHYKVL